MDEMNNDLKLLEAEFIAARCKLRNLQGKLGMFLSEKHEGFVPNVKSADDHAAEEMRKMVAASIVKLDQYEIQRDYWFEREENWCKLLELCNLK